jgi:hypothetical protein
MEEGKESSFIDCLQNLKLIDLIIMQPTENIQNCLKYSKIMNL